VPQVDSVEKIVERYFSATTLDIFTFKKKEFVPKKLRVSAGIFVRRMTCVAKCGACCQKFSLDYIPCEIDLLSSESRKRLEKREVSFNRGVEVWSDRQEDNEGYSCRHLKMDDGRCGIHGSHPFTCDFELLRFYHFEDPNDPERLDHRPFGRGWAMKRIDGERGALCEWRDQCSDPEWISDLSRKLKRLKDWADHFGIETTIGRIIEWVERGPHQRPLIVGPEEKEGFDI